MDNQQSPLVVGNDGLRGRIANGLAAGEVSQQGVLITLDDGRQVQVPTSLLVRQTDGSYRLPLGLADIRENSGSARSQAETSPAESLQPAFVVPVVREELDVQKRTIEIGHARITKHVREREEVVDEPLMRQEVAIEHVPINKIWDGPAPPARYEGDTLVVPLLAEVLVVEKRLMLTEELHISRIQKTVHEPQTVVLRSEDVDVERVEPSAQTRETDRVAP